MYPLPCPRIRLGCNGSYRAAQALVLTHALTADRRFSQAGVADCLPASQARNAFVALAKQHPAAAVEATGDERQGGMAMAVIMVGQNAGLLLGPIVFGTLAQSAGWTAAFASIAVLAVLGLVAGWLAKVR